MLTYLRIKNLALVEEISLEPESGCTMITGETGAGKSILLGAMGLALGLRGDKSLIRTGTEQATVEAVFDLSRMDRVPIEHFLDEKGVEPCEENELRIRRTLGVSGNNRQFINGTSVPVSVLASLGDMLVDIHGPHDHQSLLYPARQLAILNYFGCAYSAGIKGGYAETLKEYSETYGRLKELEKRRHNLVTDEQTYRQQLDMLKYQVKEIESAVLNEETDSNLEERYTRAEHAVDILRLVQEGFGILADDENSILTQCAALRRILREASRLDHSGLEPILVQLDRVNENLREISVLFSHYMENVEIDPEEFQEMEERLNRINGLKRKYGRTVQEIIRFGVEAEERLRQLEGRDVELSILNDEISRLWEELKRKGKILTEQRRELIPILEKKVCSHLRELGFNRGYFKIESEPLPLKEGESIGSFSEGLERVEFLFGPNPGDLPKPLKSIASSGEMARVMLALKTVLAEADRVPVLLFDEVDANVGGETALAVGRMIREIGAKRQVFCITHLAPVAASGDHQLCVVKEVKNDQTHVHVESLNKEERVIELARMLGGQMEESRKYAATLLKKCREEKQ